MDLPMSPWRATVDANPRERRHDPRYAAR